MIASERCGQPAQGDEAVTLYSQAEPASKINKLHFFTGLTVLIGGYSMVLLIMRYLLM